MAAARQQILQELRRVLPVDASLPELNGTWTQYSDPCRQFLEVLQSVGGAGMVVGSREELRAQLAQLAADVGAGAVSSALPEYFTGNVDLAGMDDPHRLADVGLAILPGELAIAENGAVWVTDDRVPHRVAYFLSQHLALVVPHAAIVNNMHEAYAWLSARSAGSPFEAARWGAFISGPSKTADIEQALVIGAHGARSLHVYLVA